MERPEQAAGSPSQNAMKEMNEPSAIVFLKNSRTDASNSADVIVSGTVSRSRRISRRMAVNSSMSEESARLIVMVGVPSMMLFKAFELCDCVKVAITIEVIWFKEASLSPFIPTVYGYETLAFRVFVKVGASHLQCLAEKFGRVVAADDWQELMETRIAVPTD